MKSVPSFSFSSLAGGLPQQTAALHAGAPVTTPSISERGIFPNGNESRPATVAAEARKGERHFTIDRGTARLMKISPNRLPPADKVAPARHLVRNAFAGSLADAASSARVRIRAVVSAKSHE